MGDSISTGVFSGTNLGEIPDSALFSQFMQYIFGPTHNIVEFQARFSDLKLSSTATDEIWGLRQKIAEKTNLSATDIPIHYSTQFGGRVFHLKKFYKELEQEYVKDNHTSEYVVIMIGSNDYCANISVDDFEQSLYEHITPVLSLHPDSKIILSYLPPITDLLDYDFSYSPLLSCQAIRLIYCKAVFQEDATVRLQQYNEKISHFAARVNDKVFENDDDESFIKAVELFKGRIYLPDSMLDMRFEKKDISFDCFHPSIEGQKKIASYLRKVIP